MPDSPLSPLLVARTTEVAPFTLTPDGRPGSAAWLRRGEGMVASGTAWRAEAKGPGRFAELSAAFKQLVAGAQVSDEVQLPGTGLIAFGSLAFADDSAEASRLIVPARIYGVRDGRYFATEIRAAGPEPGAPAGTAANHLPPAELGGPPPSSAEGPAASTAAISWSDGPVPAAAWPGRVSAAIAAIGRGEVDKVVLARALEATSPVPVDQAAVLAQLAGRYPNCWTFQLDGLLGATPELLVRTAKGLVTSRVLAGTIRRTGDEAQDLARAAQLAHSSKDLQEHEFAVRSVASALAPHCAAMNVPEAPLVLHLPNVMHLATDVTGTLLNGMTSLDLAGQLHPSAAVCGTPREAAARLIAQLEQVDRGRYSGPVGWVGGDGDGEWAIALRCAQLTDDGRRARLFAGGGIVAASDPDAELAETDAKFIPMREALR